MINEVSGQRPTNTGVVIKNTEKGRAAYFDSGTSNLNYGKTSIISNVSEFMVEVWAMAEDLAQVQYLFVQSVDTLNRVLCLSAGGNLYFDVRNAGAQNGYFSWSTACAAGKYYHYLFQFDGSGVGNAGRMKLFHLCK